MSNPLVSIVVPSLEQGRFLRKALDSILNQDYAPLEVLVMDGGSDDESVEILRSYGERLWFRSARDGGQASAINEGFRRSRGTILAWLNSDDVYYPGAVRAAVAALDAAADACLVYGEGDLIAEDGSRIARFPETVPFDLWRLANVADYILQPTVFLRREPLLAAGLLDASLHWGFDWDLWIRMGERAPFAHVPELLAASRLYGATKTASGGMRRLRELRALLRRHGVGTASPAVVAHTVTTLVRRWRPGVGPLSADDLALTMPGALARLARPCIAAGERWLRRWLQNAQGLWRDGLVARSARLWLPSSGVQGRLHLHGRNLALDAQVIEVRNGASAAKTPPLVADQPFDLLLDVPAGDVPLKLRLAAARTLTVAPLDPQLGPRRAGCVLEGCRLETA